MATSIKTLIDLRDLPLGSADDKQLTVAFQNGDDGAYQAIYDRYAPKVLGVCRRMLTNPDDAKEASQETFLRIFTALGRFNGRYQLGAWITRIAANVCLDQIKRSNRRPLHERALEDLDRDLVVVDDPEELTLRKFEGRRVHKTLRNLPPMHRAAIVLRDIEGLSYAEVALILELNECQVKALIHRARQSFRKSWSWGIAGLAPLRLGRRLRRVREPITDQANRIAPNASDAVQAVAASPQLTTCGVVIQQCSQFVGERVAPLMTAVMVGTAGAAVASTGVPAHEVGIQSRDAAAESSFDGGAAGSKALISDDTKSAEAPPDPLREGPDVLGPVVDAAPAPVAEPTEPPPPETVPEPEPEPGPEPEPPPQPEPEPEPTEPGPPEPDEGKDHEPPDPGETDGSSEGGEAESPPAGPPIVRKVGFASSSGPASDIEPTYDRAIADCHPWRERASGQFVQQLLYFPLVHEGQVYDAELELSGEYSLRFRLSFRKGDFNVSYFGRGALVGSVGDDAPTLALHYEGTVQAPLARVTGLPESAAFSADFELDCVSSRLLTEKISLHY